MPLTDDEPTLERLEHTDVTVQLGDRLLHIGLGAAVPPGAAPPVEPDQAR